MKKCWLVAGLGFGDCGKGQVTHNLASQHGASLVVRYNGGHQACHHVVLSDGVWHGFSQFGAGTFAGAATFLSRYMLIEPIAMDAEAYTLSGKLRTKAFSGLTVDPNCLIVTEYHKIANRMLEKARGPNRHGSVGLGVGTAYADSIVNRAALRVIDVVNGEHLRVLRAIKAQKVHEFLHLSHAFEKHYGALIDLKASDIADMYEQWSKDVRIRTAREVLAEHEVVVFEGAQGMLLDRGYGFGPYHSWTDATFQGALDVLREAEIIACEVARIGVVRSYFTRHGPGPFPTEDNTLVAPERHNGDHPWMGQFRVGHFDAVALDYALASIRGVDAIALTHMDCRPSELVATAYDTGPIALPGHRKTVDEVTERLLQTKAKLEPIENLVDFLRDRYQVEVLVQPAPVMLSARETAVPR